MYDSHHLISWEIKIRRYQNFPPRTVHITNLVRLFTKFLFSEVAKVGYSRPFVRETWKNLPTAHQEGAVDMTSANFFHFCSRFFLYSLLHFVF